MFGVPRTFTRPVLTRNLNNTLMAEVAEADDVQGLRRYPVVNARSETLSGALRVLLI